MNKIYKLLIIITIIQALPTRFFAQTANSNYTQETIEFDIARLHSFEERALFVHNLINDSRFNVKASENYGTLLITSDIAFDGMDLAGSFDDFCRQNQIAFAQIGQEEAHKTAMAYKSELSKDLYASLMMDDYTKSRETNTCATAMQFCTDETYTYPAGTSGTAESGPFYGNYPECLYSPQRKRGPIWYFMKINEPGDIEISISNDKDVDLDFMCWGPFSNPITPCPGGLTEDKVIDCGSNIHNPEICHIPATAQSGEYYLFVITNFNYTPCNITFSQTGGVGNTDCSFHVTVSNDGPYCVGDDIHLTANGQDGVSYSWSGPGGFTSSLQNPTRTNCTMDMQGTYTCTITSGSESKSETTEVIVNPQPTADFSFTTVCKGEATQFTNNSSTNPPGQPMTYLWDFGDGSTSTEQNPTHTFAQASNYSVQLTTSAGNGFCSDQKTKTVQVLAVPVASSWANPQTIQFGGSSQLSASAGVSGQFNFHWEPSDKVISPNSQSTRTVDLHEATTFTVTITNPQGDCSDFSQVTVGFESSDMTAIASADNYLLCEGESTTLHATPSGGDSSHYTWSWDHANTLSNPNIESPIATPPVGTTRYTCQVSDGHVTASVHVDITVNPNTESFPTVYICPDEEYNFLGQHIHVPDQYEGITVNRYGCDSTIHLTLMHYKTYDTIITEQICHGEHFTFGGHEYTTDCSPADTYQVLSSCNQCDSIVRLELTVYPPNDTAIIDVTICHGQSFNFHGNVYYDECIKCFDTVDSHGCPKVEKLILSVGDYQMPPVEERYICYGINDSPSFTWDKNGKTYTADAEDEIILPDPAGGCDFKYRLKVGFHQDYYEETSIETCDSYTWPVTGLKYTKSGIYHKSFPSGLPNFNCDSTHVLKLSITEHDEEENDLNDETEADYDAENSCNEYFWNPNGKQYWDYKYQYHPYFGGDTISKSGTYQRTYTNNEGCDSIHTLKVQFEYTPNPSCYIMSTDANIGIAPHYVITASEFLVNTYDFTIIEQGQSNWDKVEWTLKDENDNDVDWILEKEGNGEILHLTVLKYVEGRLTLTATASNRCGSKAVSHWLECSFYGLEEQPDNLSKVHIVPNPNSGQMTLHFEYLTGNVNIKVYDMKGNIVDSFNTFNSIGPNTLEYDMKNFSDGMYFFVISGKEGTVTEKVLICR